MAGEAVHFDMAGKSREEHSKRRWAESGDGRRQAMPNDRTLTTRPEDKDRRDTAQLWEQGTVKDLGGPVHLRALLGWLEQSVRPGLGMSPTCRVSAPI